MQVSKWTFLAWSTGAIIVWALYKMVRFYQSGEGRDFMKSRDSNAPVQSDENKADRDTSA